MRNKIKAVVKKIIYTSGSFRITIPKKMADAIGLEVDGKIKFELEGEKIIITKEVTR